MWFWFSLCILRVLWVSVVNLPRKGLTTETQSAQRLHRENELIPKTRKELE